MQTCLVNMFVSGSLKRPLKFLVQPHHESRSSDTGTQNLINNTRTEYQKAVPTRQEANIIFHSVHEFLNQPYHES